MMSYRNRGDCSITTAATTSATTPESRPFVPLPGGSARSAHPASRNRKRRASDGDADCSNPGQTTPALSMSSASTCRAANPPPTRSHEPSGHTAPNDRSSRIPRQRPTRAARHRRRGGADRCRTSPPRRNRAIRPPDRRARRPSRAFQRGRPRPGRIRRSIP